MTEEVEDYRVAVNASFKKHGGADRDVLQKASDYELKFVKTGSRALDRVLGGGLGIGRSAEFIGELSTLKSYFSQTMLANAQKLGMRTAIVDTEGSFEPQRAIALGVDVTKLDLIDPQLRGDEQLDVVEALLYQGNFAIVIDSVAALVPKAEAEKRMGEDTVARQAALMSKAMRKLTAANRRDCVLLFINQLRENIGVTFGPRHRAPGGKALGFYATHRVRFARIETQKEARARYQDGKLEKVQVPVRQLIQAAVEKSKVNRPFQEAVFLYDLERGLIDLDDEILNLGLELGIIQQDGQFYIFPDTNGELQRVRWKAGILQGVEAHGTHLGRLIDKHIYPGVLSAKKARPRVDETKAAPAGRAKLPK